MRVWVVLLARRDGVGRREQRGREITRIVELTYRQETMGESRERERREREKLKLWEKRRRGEWWKKRGGRELVVGSWADISSSAADATLTSTEYTVVAHLPVSQEVHDSGSSAGQSTVSGVHLHDLRPAVLPPLHTTTLSGKYVTIPTQLYL